MPSRTNTRASVAGTLTIASAALLVATIVIGSTGRSVGLGTIGPPDVGGLALFGAIVLAAIGLATTGLVGARPLDRRATRAGLFAVAFGLAAIAVSSAIGMTLTYDPLESWPAVLSLLAGMLGLAIGAPLTILAFLTTPGAPRRVALVFLAGLVLVLIGGNVVLNLFMGGVVHDGVRPLFVAGVATLVIGGAAMIGAFAAIGWLAISGDRERTTD